MNKAELVPIESLRNLGPTSARWLRDSGITTITDLKNLGPVAAWQLVRQKHPQATLNLLWALAAGLNDMDWRELSTAAKDQIRKAIEQ